METDKPAPDRVTKPTSTDGFKGRMKIFSSAKKDRWETPSYVFDPLHREFGFTIDLAASRENAKLPRFYTFEDDSLTKDWSGEIGWLNPPYGRDTSKFLIKSLEAAKRGGTVVALVASRTDVRWFHDICVLGEVRLLRGRIRFALNGTLYSEDTSSGSWTAPFGNAIVVFSPTTLRSPRIIPWAL